MKKRLLFFFRYLTASYHFRLWRRRWLNTQTLMVVGISAVFLGTLAWSAPYSGSETAHPAGRAVVPATAVMQATAVVPATSTPEALPADPNAPPTRTPLPAEYLSNGNQTIGITLAAVVLVIIVISGVLLFLPRKDEN